MTKVEKHREAIILRTKGASYSLIKTKLNLSKGTLSRWLKDIPLTDEAIECLQKNKEKKIENFRNAMRIKKGKTLDRYYNEALLKLFPFTQKELLLAGIFLYWGEGGKSESHTISINNTDPGVILFSLRWICKSLHVPKSKVKVLLHIYSDMNAKKETYYWASLLNIPLNQFLNPYIKKSKRSDLDQKGFGHGTCCLLVYDTVLKEKLLMSIRAIASHFRKV